MKQRGWLVGALSLAVSHTGLLKQRGVQEQVKTLLSAQVGSVSNILLDIERRSHFILGSTDIFDFFFKEVWGGRGGEKGHLSVSLIVPILYLTGSSIR